MKITIELDGECSQHLLALAALINALGVAPVTLAPDGYATPEPIAPPPPVINPAISVPVPPTPPAPVSVAAPPPPATPIVANASPIDVDTNGIPWDARIHSTPAGKTDKGIWRKRRGVDDATVAAVTAELRGQAGANVPPPPAATASASVDATTAPSAPPPPPVAEVPPPPPAGAVTSAGGLTFQQVMAKATAKGIDYATLNGTYAPLFGATKVPELIKRPEVWDDLAAAFEAHEA